MPSKHAFPSWLAPMNNAQALISAHANKITNLADVTSSLDVEKAYRNHFSSQQNQNYWDYYLRVGSVRNGKHRYLEVHPGKTVHGNQIQQMIKKVEWLKSRIHAGELPLPDGAFIWARATGDSNYSSQERQILAKHGLSKPTRKVTV